MTCVAKGIYTPQGPGLCYIRYASSDPYDRSTTLFYPGLVIPLSAEAVIPFFEIAPQGLRGSPQCSLYTRF
jgi:hypothetical protein